MDQKTDENWNMECEDHEHSDKGEKIGWIGHTLRKDKWEIS